MRAVVKCTNTQRDFEISIPNTAADVARYWRQTIQARCPYCPESHLEGFRQLYTQAILGGESWAEVLDAPRSLGR